MLKYRIQSGPVFWSPDRQVATVFMETAQVRDSKPIKKFTQSIGNWIRYQVTSNK